MTIQDLTLIAATDATLPAEPFAARQKVDHAAGVRQGRLELERKKRRARRKRRRSGNHHREAVKQIGDFFHRAFLSSLL